MHLPGFTAEAALGRSAAYYFATQDMASAHAPGGAVSPSISLIHRWPPITIDACSACIDDCRRRGTNPFSCINMCSFVCG